MKHWLDWHIPEWRDQLGVLALWVLMILLYAFR